MCQCQCTSCFFSIGSVKASAEQILTDINTSPAIEHCNLKEVISAIMLIKETLLAALVQTSHFTSLSSSHFSNTKYRNSEPVSR